MTKVIKKRGKVQAFIPSKIRRAIDSSARDAKLSLAKRKELIKEVAEPAISFFKKKRVVKTTDIRRSLLRRLNRRSKQTLRAWRKYDKERKK